MRFLTVNAGSASVKMAAFDVKGAAPQPIERFRDASLDTRDPRELLQSFLTRLGDERLEAVAHRVVHGGVRLIAPLRIDASVEREIESLAELAPLHNPVALRWIRAVREVLGTDMVQVAAFDTAFFAGLPRIAGEYAVPASITALGVRRYGFHGLAHEAMWRRWCALRPDLAEGGRLITIQLGGGSSIAAIEAGQPVDTSMGFSPLEGLVMLTRSGDIDPAVVPFLERRLLCSSERVLEILNGESGITGLTGLSGDVGEMIASREPETWFAVDLYCYRARKALASFIAALGGCDGVVFGGGIGEHVPEVRARILQGMAWAGITLDRHANESARGAEAKVSEPASAVAVHVIPVDEDLALARAVLEVQEKQGAAQ